MCLEGIEPRLKAVAKIVSMNLPTNPLPGFSAGRHSLRLAIQYLGTGNRLQYRLVVYGDGHGSRDFETLAQLLGFLNSAGIAVNVGAICLPETRTASILLSQTIELTDPQISHLGLR